MPNYLWARFSKMVVERHIGPVELEEDNGLPRRETATRQSGLNHVGLREQGARGRLVHITLLGYVHVFEGNAIN